MMLPFAQFELPQSVYNASDCLVWASTKCVQCFWLPSLEFHMMLLSWQNFWTVLGQLFLYVKTDIVCEYCSQTLYSRTVFTKTVHTLRTGFGGYFCGNKKENDFRKHGLKRGMVCHPHGVSTGFCCTYVFSCFFFFLFSATSFPVLPTSASMFFGEGITLIINADL